ncbi:hypothetical protein J2S08_002680 [Bacillus chungangensis]|uniref:Integrase n=1 Tax=Bacillus chungangensis TaxID=587633 RepID=A0ABT9WVA3_9BACI|nr:hypothetical protein [Bacillus chungangensis]
MGKDPSVYVSIKLRRKDELDAWHFSVFDNRIDEKTRVLF